ncbi:S39AB protein, partial [Polyodon spathula]|nr:S39AB protein [Polyodon spathula]
PLLDKVENGDVYLRRKGPLTSPVEDQGLSHNSRDLPERSRSSWRRIVLLILAITIHNIPEGLAVGVGFGAAGKTLSASFESARNLAIGIGIQNFPEGLAVSLPLRGAGMSTWKAFWYGQLSGMVEPMAGVLGAFAVVVAEPLLPYALAFAAGAMVYVVMDDIIPEAQVSGNGKLASWTSILGFVVMMSLDVGLG